MIGPVRDKVNWSSVLPGAITGIGSDLIFNALGNRARRREADRAFKRSKEMFDYQNAYNTPKRQMERLRRAGLNPALMYGQGTTGNASGFPQQAPADQQNLAGAASLQTALLKAELDNLNAKTRNIDADSDNKGKQGNILDYDTAIRKVEADGYFHASVAIKDAMKAEAEGKVSDAEIKKIDLKLRRAGFHDKYLPSVLGGLFGFDVFDLDASYTGPIEIAGYRLSDGISKREALIGMLAAWRLGEIGLEAILDLKRIYRGGKNKRKKGDVEVEETIHSDGRWTEKRRQIYGD